MWESFFKEMEKLSFGPTAIFGGLTALDVNSQAKEMQRKTMLTPIGQGRNYQLGSSNQYQFEGGKHTNFKPVRSPHRSLYR